MMVMMVMVLMVVVVERVSEGGDNRGNGDWWLQSTNADKLEGRWFEMCDSFIE